VSLLARAARSLALLALLAAAFLAATGAAWYGAFSFAVAAAGFFLITAWAKAHAANPQTSEPEDSRP
jgi:hypothetical protein